ncbi:hypothetical protein ABG067_005703 [Albugo candida]
MGQPIDNPSITGFISMPGVGDYVECALQEHRSIVTNLLESINTASLPPSTITNIRLRSVQEQVHRLLESDRRLATAVKTLWTHQITQKTLFQLQNEIKAKEERVIEYATQLRNAQVLPMSGFAPPAPQEQIMRAGVLSRGVIAETVTRDGFKPTRIDVLTDSDLSGANDLKTPIGLDPQLLVAYAHRIAGTTSAPKHWQPGLPMSGFAPPAPQEQIMRAGVLSRGVIAETVTRDGFKPTRIDVLTDSDLSGANDLKTPIGLGATDAEIRNQMPPGWKPGDPVDLPLDALLHYMGRSFFQEHGITLPESWRNGDAVPPEAMDLLRKKFNLPEKRKSDEMNVNAEMSQKKRKLETDDENSEESSDSESSSDQDTPQGISLSFSSSSDEDE